MWLLECSCSGYECQPMVADYFWTGLWLTLPLPIKQSEVQAQILPTCKMREDHVICGDYGSGWTCTQAPDTNFPYTIHKFRRRNECPCSVSFLPRKCDWLGSIDWYFDRLSSSELLERATEQRDSQSLPGVTGPTAISKHMGCCHNLYAFLC